MKKITFVLLIQFIFSLLLYSQIPNSGFEKWTNFGNYENPSDTWLSFNSWSSGEFFPVTKSQDHYPVEIGNYSIRIESDTSIAFLPPPNHPSGLGMAWTTHTPEQIGPTTAFPIIGHPNTFCGYYKFLPQKNDTMVILLVLYKDGAYVSMAQYINIAEVREWSSFEIPIPEYSEADSGSIMLASFYAFPGKRPHGNSVLYVDNLSFNELITSIRPETLADIPKHNFLSQNYPNPFNPECKIRYQIKVKSLISLTVFDLLGRKVEVLVNQIQSPGNYEVNFDRSILNSGIYIYKLSAGNFITTRKMVLLR